MKGVPVQIEMGKPIEYEPSRKDMSMQQKIDEYHAVIVEEIKRLFNRTKAKYGLATAELEIV